MKQPELEKLWQTILTTHDCYIDAKTVGTDMPVKAAGGIRSFETAMAMI